MCEKAKCNANRLVIQYGMGVVRQPYLRVMPWQVSHDGIPMILPRMGSITLNVQIGDSVYGLAGDHIEPGVTIKNHQSSSENGALNVLSCVGNDAVVISGDAKGDRGFVTGHHGGVEHVLLYFPQETLEKLVIGSVVNYALDFGDYVQYINESDPTVAKAVEVLEKGESFPKAPQTEEKSE